MIIHQHPQFFFSRSDRHSIGRMHDLFQKLSHYFIEKIDTHEWLHKDWANGDEIEKTIDPNEAMNFFIKSSAMSFCIKNGFNEPDGWIITEHIFDSSGD